MRAREIATNETLRFVLENIPAPPLRLLEVGCGSGELAKRLQDLGHNIIAIDCADLAVAQARQLGLDARVATFPDFEAALFDVILFTRSLHHIRPLGSALEQARRLLKPAGLVVVEDFAFGNASAYVTKWFYDLLKALDTSGILLPAGESFGRQLLKSAGDMSLWSGHIEEINSAAAVSDALGERFKVFHKNSVPYLYRYVAEMVPDNDQGGEVVGSVLELEKTIGIGIEDFFLGRRLVARR